DVVVRVLGDEPRGRGAVLADEAARRPAVLVDDLGEALGPLPVGRGAAPAGAVGLVVGLHGEQLLPQLGLGHPALAAGVAVTVAARREAERERDRQSRSPPPGAPTGACAPPPGCHPRGLLPSAGRRIVAAAAGSAAALEELQQVGAVAALGQLLGPGRQGVVVEPPLAPGDLLRAADLQPLAGLERV